MVVNSRFVVRLKFFVNGQGITPQSANIHSANRYKNKFPIQRLKFSHSTIFGLPVILQ
jgi:hypothetical protein